MVQSQTAARDRFQSLVKFFGDEAILRQTRESLEASEPRGFFFALQQFLEDLVRNGEQKSLVDECSKALSK